MKLLYNLTYKILGSKNKEYSHKMCFLVYAQTGRNINMSETFLSSVIKTSLRAENEDSYFSGKNVDADRNKAEHD